MRSFALLGSGEFEPWSEEVDRWMLGRVVRPDGRVLILPTASAPEGDEVFNMWANRGLRHFDALEIPAEALPLKTREDASRPGVVSKVEDAAFVYFSGGNPAYLADVLADSPFWRAVVAGIDQGLGYAGCSAGISCLGDLAPDSAVRDFSQDVWHRGLRLFPGVSFGPHWDMIDSYVPGLRRIIEDALPRGSLLFAVDERTAAVGDGRTWTVMGLGKVHLRQDGEWREWASGESFQAELLPEGATA
jgi:cyanophycinase-like exopeptidase